MRHVATPIGMVSGFGFGFAGTDCIRALIGDTPVLPLPMAVALALVCGFVVTLCVIAIHRTSVFDR